MSNIYFENIPLDEDDIPSISQTYMVPYELACQLIEQYKQGKELNAAAFSGTLKKRVEEFISMLSREQILEAEIVEPSNLISIPDQSQVKNDDIAAIMQIVTDPISEHFIIREGGQATLRQDNLPTLEQAYKVIDRIFVARDTTEKIDDYSTWLLGSITAEFENHFGTQFDVSQVMEISDKSYNTIITAVSVFKEYNGRKYNLSFSHHKEAFYAKIDKEDKDLILQKAEEIGLSAKNVRNLASICKKMGNSVIEDITTKSQVDDLIAACKDASVEYVICENTKENLWKKIKSMTEPQGEIVINLKTNTVKIQDKEYKLHTKS